MKDVTSLMLALNTKQVEIYIDELEWNKRLTGKDFNSNYKVAIAKLKDSIKSFNEVLSIKNEDLEQYSGSLSVVMEMLRNAKTAEHRTNILESIDFLARNSHSVEANKEDLLERIKMVSEISDKVFEFEPLELIKTHKKITKTPTKKKNE